MVTASWVAIDRETGRAVAEFYEVRRLPLVNRKRYRVLSILTHLQNLNGANR